MYKFAAQHRLRFTSVRGELMVEQLFDLPLKSHSGFDLDSVARSIATELKTMDAESFVEDPSLNPRKRILEVSLEIVKDVIKTRQEENSARLAKAKKAETRRKLLDALEAKQDEKLSSASVEEIEAQLAALD